MTFFSNRLLCWNTGGSWPTGGAKLQWEGTRAVPEAVPEAVPGTPRCFIPERLLQAGGFALLSVRFPWAPAIASSRPCQVGRGCSGSCRSWQQSCSEKVLEEHRQFR